MLRLLYPFEYVESVFAIDYEKLYRMGYRGIIFDIDNTLVPHGNDSTEKVDELFRQIHSIGLKTLLLSNNNEERILRFLKNIDSLYICEADKPHVANYLKAVEMLGIKKEQAVVIGDQIFTDIYGANKSGIPNILVQFIRAKDEKKIGKRRRVEQVILIFYGLRKSYQNRIGDIHTKEDRMFKKKGVLFCDINPTCYAISLKKEICKRHIKNLLSKDKFAKTRKKQKLPNVISDYHSNLIKKGKGIDPVLQENKAVNIDLACKKINGMVIQPGEVFSFWKTVGKTTKKKGYKDGRVIIGNKLKPGLGGGLCNLANTIHLLVLHSPLEVTEIHKHSDALAPDHGKRVPFSAGTSVSYNYIDYRFKNNTDQDIQLRVWCKDGQLFGELRSERDFPWSYEIVEEDHHFSKEAGKYYRISRIYKETREKSTGKSIKKELIWDNHSEVMFDYSLIPEEQIRA